MQLSTTYIILIVLTLVFLVVVLACFWDCLPGCGSSSCGSSDCGSSDCLSKKKCDKYTKQCYCKKCGTIPCCCSEANVTGVTRTRVLASASGSGDGDEYLMTVEGSGLTTGSITSVVLYLLDPLGVRYPDDAIAPTVHPVTYAYGNTAGYGLSFAASGYSLSFMFTTGPIGGVVAGLLSPTTVALAGIPTATLVGTVLTVQMPLTVLP